MSIKNLKLDTAKSAQGVWLSCDNDFMPCDGVDDGTEKVLIARMPNSEYSKLRLQLQKPYKRLIQRGGEIPDAVAKDITAELIARTVWLNSQNLEFDEPFEHTPKAAKAIILDPQWEQFVDVLCLRATDPSLFSPDDIEADAKN